MNRSRIFTDNEIQEMQQKRERLAGFFADFVTLDYLINTAEKCIETGSYELALEHMKRLQTNGEDVIAKLHSKILQEQSKQES